MSPVGRTELQRLLGSTRPEDRIALLDFARTAPLVYGWWREWKWLFKQVEVLPDPELLGVLMGRLDRAPFPLSGPAALTANPLQIENVVGLAMAGTLAYVLLGGSGERRNVRVFDLSDPSAPVELAGTHVGKAVRLLLQGARLFVFSRGSWQKPDKVHTFDVSQTGLLTSMGVLEAPQSTLALGAEGHVFLLDQTTYPVHTSGLHILNVTSAGALEKRGHVAIGNPLALGVSGNAAAVLCQGSYSGPMTLQVFDIADVTKPRRVHSVEVPGAMGLAIQGNLILVTIGSAPAYFNAPPGGQTPGLRVFRLSSGLLAAVGLQAGLREVASLELGNARAVQVVGRYAYVCLSHQGSHRTKNLRPGGLRIVDIGDPDRPTLVGALDGIDAQSVTVVGDRAYVGTSLDSRVHSYYGSAGLTPRTLRVVDVSDSTQPMLLGTSPSRDTLGYMKRRARRVLRALAKTNSDAFVQLAFETLTQAGTNAESVDLTTQWVSADLLFGGTGRDAQSSHGRGGYRQVRPGLSRRTRDERSPAAWDRRPDLAGVLLVHPGLPWQTQEMALKVLQTNGIVPPAVPIPVLSRMLDSPSPLLVAFAVRQVAAQLDDTAQIAPKTTADAFFFGGVALRRRIGDTLGRQTWSDGWWAGFARRVFERATMGLTAGRLSRRQIGAAVFLATELPEALPAKLLRPVFGALLAAGSSTLTWWVLQAVQRATPAEALGWLVALTEAPDAVREQGVVALRAGLRDQAFDYTAAWALVQADSDWVREQGWTLLAQGGTDMGIWARVWGELLDSPQMTPALATAFASPDALGLLRQIPLDGNVLIAQLESRPFLAPLLSGDAFALVARTLPPVVLLRLIASMPDAQWQGVRTEFVETLGEGGRLGDFWHAAWDVLGGGADSILEARLLGSPDFAGSFLTVDDPAFLEATTNPLFDDLLGLWVQAHTDLFVRDSPLLLTAATHPLPAVRAWALRRVAHVGLGLPFALRLLESELPASVAVGQNFFEAALAGSADEFAATLALCDSPKASVRAWGRGFADRRWPNLPTVDLLRQLSENGDPQTQAFLAAKLRGLSPEDAPDPRTVQEFDRQVLRARDQGRRAKELVKARRDQTPVPQEDTLDMATLLQMARSRTPRDAEWALGQLARLALAGQGIDGLTLDGPAGV